MAIVSCPFCNATCDMGNMSLATCPACRGEFSAPSQSPMATPVTIRPAPRKRTKKPAGVDVSVLATCLTLGLIFSCCGGCLVIGRHAAENGIAVAPVSNVGHLEAGGGELLVSKDMESFDRLTRYAVAKDYTGVSELILEGKLLAVDHGTEVLIIRPGILVHEVRIMSGSQRGKRGFVAVEFVKQ